MQAASRTERLRQALKKTGDLIMMKASENNFLEPLQEVIDSHHLTPEEVLMLRSQLFQQFNEQNKTDWNTLVVHSRRGLDILDQQEEANAAIQPLVASYQEVCVAQRQLSVEFDQKYSQYDQIRSHLLDQVQQMENNTHEIITREAASDKLFAEMELSYLQAMQSRELSQNPG